MLCQKWVPRDLRFNGNIQVFSFTLSRFLPVHTGSQHPSELSIDRLVNHIQITGLKLVIEPGEIGYNFNGTKLEQNIGQHLVIEMNYRVSRINHNFYSECLNLLKREKPMTRSVYIFLERYVLHGRTLFVGSSRLCDKMFKF